MNQTRLKNYFYYVLTLMMVVAAVAMPMVTPDSVSKFLERYRNFATCALVLVSAIAIMASSLKDGGLRFNPAMKAMMIFSALAVPCALISLDRAQALGKCALYFSWLAVTIVTASVFHRRPYFTKFVFLFAVGAGILLSFGITGALGYQGGAPYGESVFGISSAYGACLLAYLFFLQGASIAIESRAVKILAALVLALLVVRISWCDSYSLWILAAVGEVALLLWWAARKGVSSWKIAVAILIFVAIAGGAFKHRLDRREVTSPLKKKASVNVRLQRWDIARDMIKDRPLFGHGPGQYEVMFPKYRAEKGVEPGLWERDVFLPYEVNAENIIMTLLIENGFAGAALFLFAIGWSLFSGIKLARTDDWRSAVAPTFTIGLVMIFLYAMFHFPFVTPGVWPVIWIGAAMLWPDAPASVLAAAPQKASFLKSNIPLTLVLSIVFAYFTLVAVVYSTSDDRASKAYIYARAGKDGAPPETNALSAVVPPTWRQRAFYAEALSSDPGREEAARSAFKSVEKIRPYSIALYRRELSALRTINKALGDNPYDVCVYERKIFALGGNSLDEWLCDFDR